MAPIAFWTNYFSSAWQKLSLDSQHNFFLKTELKYQVLYVYIDQRERTEMFVNKDFNNESHGLRHFVVYYVMKSKKDNV